MAKIIGNLASGSRITVAAEGAGFVDEKARAEIGPEGAVVSIVLQREARISGRLLRDGEPVDIEAGCLECFQGRWPEGECPDGDRRGEQAERDPHCEQQFLHCDSPILGRVEFSVIGLLQDVPSLGRSGQMFGSARAGERKLPARRSHGWLAGLSARVNGPARGQIVGILAGSPPLP